MYKSTTPDTQGYNISTGNIIHMVLLIMSVVISALFVFSVTPKLALAEEVAPTGTISITNTTGSPVTYEATMIADKNALTVDKNFNWKALSGTEIAGVKLPEYTDEKDLESGRDLVEALNEIIAKDESGEIALDLTKHLMDGRVSKQLKNDGSKMEVDNGYYLLTAEGRRPLIAWVHGNDLNLGDKSDAPVIDKTVKAANSNDPFAPSTIFGAGNTLQYKIDVKVPESYKQFSAYKMDIEDTFDNRLSIYDDSISVSLVHGETAIDITNNELVKSAINSNVLTVTLEDVVKLGAISGDTISLQYCVNPNVSGVIGSAGLTNEAFCHYPSYNGISETTSTKTRVFTLKMFIEKTNSLNKEPLAGATFAIRNKNNEWLNSDGLFGDIQSRSEFISDGNGAVNDIPNLGKGTYDIVEIKAPDGYTLKENPVTTVVISGESSLENVKFSADVSGMGTIKNLDAENGQIVVAISNDPAGTVTTRVPRLGDMAVPLAVGFVGVLAIILALLAKREDGDEDSSK